MTDGEDKLARMAANLKRMGELLRDMRDRPYFKSDKEFYQAIVPMLEYEEFIPRMNELIVAYDNAIKCDTAESFDEALRKHEAMWWGLRQDMLQKSPVLKSIVEATPPEPKERKPVVPRMAAPKRRVEVALSRQNAHTEIASFKLKPAEKKALVEIAQKKGITLSELVRGQMLFALGNFQG